MADVDGSLSFRAYLNGFNWIKRSKYPTV